MPNMKILAKRIGRLVNLNMHDWLDLEITFPLEDIASALTCM